MQLCVLKTLDEMMTRQRRDYLLQELQTLIYNALSYSWLNLDQP